MLHVTIYEVEIYFAKICFLDCKLSNLNAPGSYTPWCHALLGSTVGCPFQEKGNDACSTLFRILTQNYLQSLFKRLLREIGDLIVAKIVCYALVRHTEEF